MQLHYVNGDKQGKVEEINPPGICFGREEDNDVQIMEHGVSRYHAKIEYLNDKWTIRDLASSNGTIVNGRKITDDQELKTGDSIKIGAQVFHFGEKGKNSVFPTSSGTAAAGKAPLLSNEPPPVLRPSPSTNLDMKAADTPVKTPEPPKEAAKPEPPKNDSVPKREHPNIDFSQRSQKNMDKMLVDAIAAKKRKLKMIILVITVVANILVLTGFIIYWLNRGNTTADEFGIDESNIGSFAD